MADTASGGQTAFLYTGGTMYEILTLLAPGSGVSNLQVSAYGNSINDLGQIAAYGIIAGQQHALRLDPVPEPSCATLLVSSACMLLLRRRRSPSR